MDLYDPGIPGCSSSFTTLDPASGNWQVEIEEDRREETAFSTPHGHFEFNFVPFGIRNALATFHWIIKCILAGLTPE